MLVLVAHLSRSVVGMLALKKSAIATTLMIPLLVGTILFSNYIKQEHFRVTNYRKCSRDVPPCWLPID